MPSKSSKVDKGLAVSLKNDINEDCGKIIACRLILEQDDKNISQLELQIQRMKDELSRQKKAKTARVKKFTKVASDYRADLFGKLFRYLNLSEAKLAMVVGYCVTFPEGTSSLDKQRADFDLEMEHIGEQYMEEHGISSKDATDVNLKDFANEHSDVSDEYDSGSKKRKSSRKKKSAENAEMPVVDTDSLDADTDEGTVVNG